MKSIISVRNLTKRYRLGESEAPYRTLRESLMAAARAPLRRVRARRRRQAPAAPARAPAGIDALRDVSFEVEPGEVVGVIGRNGAGKSTLLKVLSRIVPPTAGEVDLLGRVGSLLEVGTGFHQELTGRENIYLNGAILGMSRGEVARKFDAIVDFAEIEKFLDTPVKRYSSGMYMRLAFAVASHLEPEILIVDEVLAVGDAAFQRKCLGRMGQVSKAGRTVLFVSHNLAAVKSLCGRALLIEAGRVACDGDVGAVVHRYLDAESRRCEGGRIPEDAPRLQDVPGQALFRTVALTDLEGREATQLYFGQPFRVRFTCDVLKEIPEGHFEVSVSTDDGTHVAYATTLDGGAAPRCLLPGRHEVAVDLDAALLPRQYTVDLGVHHNSGATADFVQHTLSFTVLRVAENGRDHYPWARTRGLVRPPSRWDLAGSPSPHA